MPDTSMEECENCASPDTDVAPVRRVYLHPDADGDDGFTVLDEVERWCFSCRSQYPNDPA